MNGNIGFAPCDLPNERGVCECPYGEPDGDMCDRCYEVVDDLEMEEGDG